METVLQHTSCQFALFVKELAFAFDCVAMRTPGALRSPCMLRSNICTVPYQQMRNCRATCAVALSAHLNVCNLLIMHANFGVEQKHTPLLLCAPDPPPWRSLCPAWQSRCLA